MYWTRHQQQTEEPKNVYSMSIEALAHKCKIHVYTYMYYDCVCMQHLLQVYRVEGVRVVVVDVITWTMGDPIEITTDSGDFLDIFRDYSPSLPQKYDSAMLFTLV